MRVSVFRKYLWVSFKKTLLNICILLIPSFIHWSVCVSLCVSEAEGRFGQIDSCQSATWSSCCSLHLEWTCRFLAQVRWEHEQGRLYRTRGPPTKCHCSIHRYLTMSSWNVFLAEMSLIMSVKSHFWRMSLNIHLLLLLLLVYQSQF